MAWLDLRTNCAKPTDVCRLHFPWCFTDHDARVKKKKRKQSSSALLAAGWKTTRVQNVSLCEWGLDTEWRRSEFSKKKKKKKCVIVLPVTWRFIDSVFYCFYLCYGVTMGFCWDKQRHLKDFPLKSNSFMEPKEWRIMSTGQFPSWES